MKRRGARTLGGASLFLLLALGCSSDPDKSTQPSGWEPPNVISLSHGAQDVFGVATACMEDVVEAAGTPGVPLTCTANDLNLFFTIPGQGSELPVCLPGDPIPSLEVEAHFAAGASERFDVGLWIRADNQPIPNALRGDCRHWALVPVSDAETVGDIRTAPFFDADGDTCGDLQQDIESVLPLTLQNLTCQDTDNDGFLDIGACVSYDNNGNSPNSCTDPHTAPVTTRPNTKSKCACGPLGIPVRIAGKIIIEKQTAPDGDAEEFSFTGTGPDGNLPGLAGSISDGETIELTVEAGQYTSTEGAEAGWNLTGVVCTDSNTGENAVESTGDAGTRTATINVEAGETVTCVFTNTKQSSIKIVKDAVPNAGVDFSFTATGTGMTPTPFSLDDDADGTLSNEQLFSGLAPGGTRTVTEDGETGWALTNIVCTGATSSTVAIIGADASAGFQTGDNQVSIGLAAGENVVCTYTNTKLGSIKIVKDAVPDDAQDFSFAATGTGMTPTPFSLDDDVDGTVSNERTFSNLLPGGTRTVTEDGEAGWTLTNIACTGATTSTVAIIGADADPGFQAGDNQLSIGLADGENIVCTYTNSKLGSIKIVKDALPNSATNFSYVATGAGMTPTPFELDDDADVTLTNEQLFSGLVAGGTRTVTEDGESGWALTNIVCTGATTSTVAIIGADADPAYQTGDNQVSIGLTEGENIVCTYTNTKLGSIKIVKDANPNDAQDFGFAATGTGMTPTPFDLDDDADGTLSNEQLFSGLLPGGTRTVTEDGETGWTLTNIVCTGATNSTVAIIGADANAAFQAGDNQVSIGLADGENIVCTYTNTKQGSIKIVKDAKNPETDAEDFTFTATGTGMTPTPFDLDDDADGTLSNEQLFSGLLPNGARTATEGTETEWVLTLISCTGATSSTIAFLGANADPAFQAGDNQVSVGLAAGENIVCTFKNERKARLIVDKIVTGGGTQSFDFTVNPGSVTFALQDATTPYNSGFSLAPGTYTVCEKDLAVAWSATATLTPPGGAATLINPDAANVPPEDLGNRCVEVVLAYGDSKTVVWTNNPPPGGDARTIGYWKNWSSCTGGNQFIKATAPGGVGLGKTLDGNLPLDLLGAFGTYDVTTCPQAVKILSKQDQAGKSTGGDAAYILAAQLLGAMLNVSAGVTPCTAAANAITDGQKLLGSTGGTLSDGTVVAAGSAANFTGSGTYWKGGKNASTLRAKATAVAAILDSFNNNTLCP